MNSLIISSLKELEEELLSLRGLMSYFDQAKDMIEETRSLVTSFLDLKDNTELLYLSSEKIYNDLEKSNLKGLHDAIASLTDFLANQIGKNQELLINKLESSQQRQSAISTDLNRVKEQTDFLKTESLIIKDDLKNGIRIFESNFAEVHSLFASTKVEIGLSEKNILEQIELTGSNFVDSLSSISLEINKNLKNGFEVLEKISDDMRLSIDSIKDKLSSVEKNILEKSEETGSRLFQSLQSLHNTIDGLELPKRLAKIDEALFTIQQSIINNQSRIESIERNIKDEINFRTGDLRNELISKLQEDMIKSEMMMKTFGDKFENYKIETKKLIEENEQKTHNIVKSYFSAVFVILGVITVLIFYMIFK